MVQPIRKQGFYKSVIHALTLTKNDIYFDNNQVRKRMTLGLNWPKLPLTMLNVLPTVENVIIAVCD